MDVARQVKEFRTPASFASLIFALAAQFTRCVCSIETEFETGTRLNTKKLNRRGRKTKRKGGTLITKVSIRDGGTAPTSRRNPGSWGHRQPS